MAAAGMEISAFWIGGVGTPNGEIKGVFSFKYSSTETRLSHLAAGRGVGGWQSLEMLSKYSFAQKFTFTQHLHESQSFIG